MRRQLQIKDGKVQGEWQGGGGMPLPPDTTWTFLDVTNRPEAQVGHAYDPVTDTFTPPPLPPDYGRTVSPREFLRLFTPQERIAFRNAAKTDDLVADFAALAQVPEPIRLKHPDTVAGLGLLVAKGLLTAARRDAILAS